jgi:hypothetical protein
MNMDYKVKFPCGYELTAQVNGWFVFNMVDVDTKNLPVCPIHGNNCKKR